MKNFLLFSLIVVVALFYVTSANPTGIKLNFYELRNFVKQFKFMQEKTYSEIDNTLSKDQLLNATAEYCYLNSGKAESFSTVKNRIKGALTCLLATQPNSADWADALKVFEDENSFRTLAPLMCNAKQKIDICFDEFQNDINDCFPDEKKLSFNRTSYVKRALGNHFCSQNIEDLDSLLSMSEDECYNSHERISGYKNCLLEKFQNESSTYFPEILENLNEKCDNLVNFKDCFGKVFAECEYRKPIKVAQSFIQVAIDTTPCKKSNNNFKTFKN